MVLIMPPWTFLRVFPFKFHAITNLEEVSGHARWRLANAIISTNYNLANRHCTAPPENTLRANRLFVELFSYPASFFPDG